MIKTKQTTSIKLHDYNGNIHERWYISYTYYSQRDSKNKRVKIYLGLNFKKTLPARYEESKQITKFINIQLKDGWNPDDCSLEHFVSGEKSDQSQLIDFLNEKINTLEGIPNGHARNYQIMLWAIFSKN